MRNMRISTRQRRIHTTQSTISKENQKVHIKNLNYTFEFKVSEPIHVEYSFKFSKEDIRNLCLKTGFTSVKNFYDSKNYFMDALWCYKSNSSAL